MDAETRHQLKTNDLGEALKKVNDPWVGYALVAVLLFFAGWFGYKYMQDQAVAKQAAEWRVLREANPTDPATGGQAVNQLKDLAQRGGSVGAAARLRLGLAQRTLGRNGAPESFQTALTELSALANDASADRAFRAAAMYAAGLTHEDMRQTTEAKAMYERLQGDENLAGTPYKEMASDRLTALEEMGTPVTFEPGLPPLADLDAMIGPAPVNPATPINLADVVEQAAANDAPADSEAAPAAESPDEPGTEEPAAETPGSEEPDVPATEDPGVEEPAAEEPGADEPATEEPAETPAEEPGSPASS